MQPVRTPGPHEGGTGTFGNASNVTYSLAGRLSYSNTASGSILTINMAGLNLPTLTDNDLFANPLNNVWTRPLFGRGYWAQ